MLSTPAANASPDDMEHLERYLVYSQPGCADLAPSQYLANRAMARNMVGYLTTVGSSSKDRRARAAASRLMLAFSFFNCAYPDRHITEPPPPPTFHDDPPFSPRAPELGNVPDEEQKTAADLAIRYENDAKQSAVNWKNAEALRLSLARRGMSLNAQASASLGRLQPLFGEAAAELRDHKWDEALSTLQAIEATSKKIGLTTGP